MNRRLEQAHRQYDAGEYDRAFVAFMEAAQNGDVHAMNQVASMYTAGEGVQCDYERALEWELKSWDGGNVSAAINIAITYRIRGDIAESKKWLEKALENGDGEAALQLAKLYLVSEKERDRIEELLNYAIANDRTCEDSIEEANGLLKIVTR